MPVDITNAIVEHHRSWEVDPCRQRRESSCTPTSTSTSRSSDEGRDRRSCRLTSAAATPALFAIRELGAHSGIENRCLTGQDVAASEVARAAQGGVIAASAVLGRKVLDDLTCEGHRSARENDARRVRQSPHRKSASSVLDLDNRAISPWEKRGDQRRRVECRRAFLCVVGAARYRRYAPPSRCALPIR